MTDREYRGLATDRVSLLVRLLQLIIIGILLAGIRFGRLGVIVNAVIGLFVTQLPALFERRYEFTMNAGLVLWITVSMLFHAVGILPMPGVGVSKLYSSVWWWDHVTHTLSSSLVAEVGYAAARAIDVHTDAINLPPKFLFVYLFLFVMAIGVLWELLEFYVSLVSHRLGLRGILVQYGLTDTVLDLTYNMLGAVLVAILGSASLTDVSDELAERLSARND
ncbi:hypothetical protein [Natrinema ejinorense]|uniref:DUF2238 domain-containing protein n=1 Tax=Natrinema ejinorense TaxID=373386 RepID=A0A2A5QU46_9EURY|nr:hypothetical protein [Natrinema ejinorense]PCR90378.1 hypothetical protein CP557_07395 [Natrinema ejinorense]